MAHSAAVIRHMLPLRDFVGLRMSFTQYDVDGAERRLGRELLAVLGAKERDDFGKKHTHLLCPCVTGNKCRAAATWIKQDNFGPRANLGCISIMHLFGYSQARYYRGVGLNAHGREGAGMAVPLPL